MKCRTIQSKWAINTFIIPPNSETVAVFLFREETKPHSPRINLGSHSSPYKTQTYHYNCQLLRRDFGETGSNTVLMMLFPSRCKAAAAAVLCRFKTESGLFVFARRGGNQQKPELLSDLNQI